jgi:hypothetical protein
LEEGTIYNISCVLKRQGDNNFVVVPRTWTGFLGGWMRITNNYGPVQSGTWNFDADVPNGLGDHDDYFFVIKFTKVDWTKEVMRKLENYLSLPTSQNLDYASVNLQKVRGFSPYNFQQHYSIDADNNQDESIGLHIEFVTMKWGAPKYRTYKLSEDYLFSMSIIFYNDKSVVGLDIGNQNCHLYFSYSSKDNLIEIWKAGARETPLMKKHFNFNANLKYNIQILHLGSTMYLFINQDFVGNFEYPNCGDLLWIWADPGSKCNFSQMYLR